MSDAAAIAGLSRTMETTRDLADGRRGTLVAQILKDGWEVFAGYKVVDGKRFDVTTGAWTGARWEKWKNPTWGVRAEVRF